MSKNERKVLKAILSLIYLIGTVCVILFSIMYWNHSTRIPNPDAMLPMMEYEIAACRLIFGLPFMIGSCIAMHLVYKIKQVKKVLLVYIPSIVCLVMSVIAFL